MPAFSFVTALLLAAAPIVGGRPVPPGGHPEALALAREHADGHWVAACTLSLIGPRVALGAAHCFEDEAGFRVYSGNGGDAGLDGPYTTVERVVTHPLFREHPLGQADLAIVFLAEELPGSRPVPVAHSLADFHALTSSELTLVGFGRREGGDFGTKYAALAAVAAATNHELVTAADGRDACAGDSGGPALFRRGDELVLGGIIARGRFFDCGRGGYISVVTDAACWIAAETGMDGGAACAGTVPDFVDEDRPFGELCSAAARGSLASTPTQRETIAALQLTFGTADCATLAAKLRAATSLDLDFLMLRDLSPLAHLPALETLSLRGNRLTGIAPLATLPMLRKVALDGNDITDFSPLAGVEIHGLRRQLHNFADTAFVHACTAAATPAAARATVAAIFWKTQTDDCRTANQRLLALTTLDLADRGLTDLSPLTALPAIKRLNLTGNAALSDVTPLAAMEDLTALDLTGTAVTDLTPLAAQIARGLVIRLDHTLLSSGRQSVKSGL